MFPAADRPEPHCSVLTETKAGRTEGHQQRRGNQWQRGPRNGKRRVVRIPVESLAIPPGRRFFVFEEDRVMQIVVACQADHDAWRSRLMKSRPPLVDRTVVCTEPEEIMVATSLRRAR